MNETEAVSNISKPSIDPVLGVQNYCLITDNTRPYPFINNLVLFGFIHHRISEFGRRLDGACWPFNQKRMHICSAFGALKCQGI
jgi:hypothetical protein